MMDKKLKKNVFTSEQAKMLANSYNMDMSKKKNKPKK